MAVSLNSVLVFDSSAKYLFTFESRRACALQTSPFTSPLRVSRLRKSTSDKKRGLCLLVAKDDRLVMDSSKEGLGNEKISDSDRTSAVTLPPLDTETGDNGFQSSAEVESRSQACEASNSAVASPYLKEEAPSVKEKAAPKKSPLTAREKLRAARVLSRYTESKASKSELGSKVLEALRESDKGKKKSGLPEAPTNLFDDSKRGLPKQGLTFELPVGIDVFIIIFSFVLISTVMFATTYLVWKLGAIHFNEY